MKNNGTNRSPVLRGTLRALGLVGVLGMAGAIVLIGPLAGSGCNESNSATSTGGHGGTVGGTGGHGGVTGAGGGGGSAVDAGGDGSVVSPTASNVLIQGMAFMPDTLTVAPGATVNVHNVDTSPHTMTSESAPGTLMPGGVAGVSFNTDLIPAGGNASFTIPANAPHGTIVPFFCIVHGALMQGTLTVQ